MSIRRYDINDKLVVVAFTMLEAKALYSRSQQHTGIKKSMKLVMAEEKLKTAIDAKDNS